jgi:hypothetical protein
MQLTHNMPIISPAVRYAVAATLCTTPNKALPPGRSHFRSNFDKIWCMPNDPPGLEKLYELYRDYIKHEDDLINHRSTWHVLIQGFLFATLGYMGQWQGGSNAPDSWHIERQHLVLILASVGVIIGLLAFRSTRAAVRASKKICETWNDNIENVDVYKEALKLLPGLAGGGDITAVKMGKQPAIWIPIVIAVAWVAVAFSATHDYLAAKQPNGNTVTHQCGEPKTGDLSKLSEQDLIQELACSDQNAYS